MFILMCIVLLLFPQRAAEGAYIGARMAINDVLPSILPFAAASSAVVYSGAGEKISSCLKPVFKLLHLNPMSAAPFFVSFLSGYPTGCKMVCDMYKEGLAEKSEAEKMLAFTNNGGLVFALNVCGKSFFKDTLSGLTIFFVSFAAALITGCILGRSDVKDTVCKEQKKPPVAAVFGKSIASGGNVLLNVLSSFIVMYALIYALGLDKLPFFGGVADMTLGLKFAGETKNAPLGAFFFSLGGVGVLAQSAAICARDDIDMKYCIKGKILSSVLAFAIAYLIVKIPYMGKETILFSAFALISHFCAIKMLRTTMRSILKKNKIFTYFRGNR